MIPGWLSDQITALRCMFMDSGLPGLKIICGFGSPARRGAWLLVFLVMFVMTMKDIASLAIEFYQYPDSLTIKYEEPEGGLKMPLPAVTVCNLNPYKWNLFCNNIDSLLIASERIVTVETQRNLSLMKDLYCTQKADRNEGKVVIWELDQRYRSLMKHFAEWSNVLQRNTETFGIMKRISFDLEETVELLTLDSGFLIRCDESKPNKTALELQNCAKYRRRNPKPVEKMYARYGMCFCYFCNYTRNESEIARQESFDGPQNGLVMVLNVAEHTYLPFITEAGFIIAVHDQGVEVDFMKDGVFVQPLATTFIGVSRRVLRRLREPYQNPCRSEWPSFLKAVVEESNKYTAFECRNMCHQYMIQTRVGCTALKYFILRVRNASDPSGYSDKRERVCGLADSDAVRRIETEIQNKVIDCQCNSVCAETTFEKSISALPWHPHSQLQAAKEDDRNNKAKVYVYMKSILIESRKKIPKTNTREFVAGIGSIMGMYMGYSFLLCWNILDILARASVNTYRAYRNVKDRQRESGNRSESKSSLASTQMSQLVQEANESRANA